MILNNFKNKTVIVTGHTGFKGSWLSQWLILLGAKVIGISNNIPSVPSHFKLINLKKNIVNKQIDVVNLKELKKYLGKKTFMMTYGDGLSNVDLKKLLRFHINSKKLVTLTAVRPPARFGDIKVIGKNVKYFKEKSKLDEGWINAGFFVMEPKFLKYIKNDQSFLEREPMEILTKKKQLIAFKYKEFWQCMDTLRDKEVLEIILRNNRYL